MGTSVNAQQHSNSDYVKSVQTMNEIIMTRFFSPYKRFNFIYYFASEYRREKRALKTIHGHTESVIESRRRELTRKRNCTTAHNQETNGTVKGRLAFLDLLLQCEIDGRPLTNEEIRQEVDTFMFEVTQLLEWFCIMYYVGFFFSGTRYHCVCYCVRSLLFIAESRSTGE